MGAVFTFAEGGYLFVDELENHFNREIVSTLIRFFMDNKVNKKGATLIFLRIIQNYWMNLIEMTAFIL